MAGPDCRRGVMVAVCGFCFGLLAERIGVSYAVFMIKKFDKTWLRNRWRKAYTKAVLAGRQSVFCSAGMPNVPFWIAKRHVWHSHLACFASRNDPFCRPKRVVLACFGLRFSLFYRAEREVLLYNLLCVRVLVISRHFGLISGWSSFSPRRRAN